MVEEERRGYNILVTGADELAVTESIAPQITAPSIGAVQPENEGLTGEVENLSINGKTVPFSRGDEGYQIYYMPPAPSLLEAARNFVDTQREIDE